MKFPVTLLVLLLGAPVSSSGQVLSPDDQAIREIVASMDRGGPTPFTSDHILWTNVLSGQLWGVSVVKKCGTAGLPTAAGGRRDL